MMQRHTRALALAALLGLPVTARAQEPTRLGLGGMLTANGEAERYLRLLQLAGRIPAYPVAIRPWTRHEAALLRPTAEHPWASRFSADSARTHGAANLQVLRPGAGLTYNSTFAEGEGEGPVWLGRGLTVQGEGGVRATLGVLDVQLAPVAFWAQNASFPIALNGAGAGAELRDARYPNNIDLPQRFGTSGYGRIDPGYSRVAADTRWVSGGFSTAPLAWGPARDEPLVLGPGAGGFPHVFVGSGEPLPVGIGRVHLKLATGRLEQSAWSPVTSGDRSRFITAAVVSLQPRGIRGLEAGFVRQEERIWTPGVVNIADALRPFTGILSDPKRLLNAADANGYASIFARWAIAPAGVEVYTEFAREDYAGNIRWLLQKPDDLASLLVGFQRVFRVSARGMSVLRAELVNAELSHNERQQRGFTVPIPPYIHNGVYQGVTLRGQLLGSPTAYGGAGWRVAYERYDVRGRTSWELQRRLVRDWLPVSTAPQGPVVWYTARANRLMSLQRLSDVNLGAGVTWAMNQDPVSGNDRVQLQLTAGWQGW